MLPASAPTLTLPPPDAPLPVRGVAQLPLRLEIPCGPNDAAPDGISVQYELRHVPAWVSATLARDRDRVAYEQCNASGRAILVDAIAISVLSSAPAFQPQEIVARATVTHPFSDAVTAQATTVLVAGFDPRLQVAATSTSIRLAPGHVAIVPIDVANLGNANTKVTFDALSSDPALQVASPPPVVLQSAQAGGSVTRVQVPMTILDTSAASRATPGTIVLRYASAYALDPALQGERGEVVIRVSAIDAFDTSDPVRHVPADAGSLLGVALALGAILLRRR